ncbi:MAG: hypothetical protein E6H73_02165 [Betaproteobacteria bacterium]|nr:MAG: hypothetical protein E6H73_02165 [Betaproteobacteria bacterium]
MDVQSGGQTGAKACVRPWRASESLRILPIACCLRAAIAEGLSGWHVAVTSPTTSSLAPDLLRKDFRDLGYVEGHNLVIDIRSAEGSAARLPALAADLGELKPDVIVTSTTDGALAAKQATRTIPIVIMQVSDPVGSGLIASLTHPGGNITGVTDYGVDLTGSTSS